jgi:hypothetical protein
MNGSFQVSVRPTDLSDRTVNLFLVLLLARLGSEGYEFGLFFELTKSVRRSFYSSALHFKVVNCIECGLFKKVDIDRSVYRYFIFPKLPQTVIKRFGLNIPELKNLEKNELLVLDSETDERVKVTL